MPSEDGDENEPAAIYIVMVVETCAKWGSTNCPNGYIQNTGNAASLTLDETTCCTGTRAPDHDVRVCP